MEGTSSSDVIEGKGEICITQQIAANRYDRRTFIKVSIRELLIYSIFFTCLCVAAFATVNTPMYYYTHVMRRLFTETKFATEDKKTIDMREINTMAHVWNYLSEVVARSVDWSFWYSSFDKIDETVGEDQNILYDNRLIGNPRMRQVRVTNQSCSVPEIFSDVFKHCYGHFSSATEDTNPIPCSRGEGVDATDTMWNYHPGERLGTFSFSGDVATYSGGGYYKDLRENAETDTSLLTSLKNQRWISRATRAIFIDLTTYNANINVFCFIKLIFEFPPTGGVLPSTHFNTMKLIRYHSVTGIIVLVSEVILAVFTVYFIIEEIIEIFALKSDYFNSWWTILDLSILCFLISYIMIAIVRGVIVNNSITSLINKKNEYASFDRLILIQNVFHYITAFLVFLAMLKFLRYLKMNLVMNRLINIIYESSPALFGFAFIFFIIMMAFALLGHLLFGTEVIWFSSVSDSLFSLHLMLLGDVNYQDLEDANRIVGPLFFCTYLFFVFFILLNMFVAILNERFWAKNKQIDLDTEDSLGLVLKQALQTFMNMFGCGRLVDKWQQRDDDRKGITRLKKLRESLARSGFSDAEITAFLDKYEIDEDSLAADNADDLIEKLKSDLQGLGSFDSSVQERIMNRIDTIENTLLSIHKKLDVINLRLRL